MIFKNKKLTAGTTAAWIVATAIIVLGLAVFFMILIPIALNAGALDSKIIYEDSKLLSTKSFLAFLNSQSDNNYLVKDDIVFWANDGSSERKDRIVKRFDEFISSSNFECYILEIKADKTISTNEKGLLNYGGFAEDLQTQQDFLNKGISLFLPIQNSRFVQIKFYGGSCALD